MKREKYICRVTLVGGIINFFLVLFKFFAGFFGHSSAMIADAVHSLSDFISDAVILLCIKASSKPEDEDHEYGHGKFETLATVSIGLILFFTGLGLFWNGCETILAFLGGQPIAQPNMLAFAAALISIIVKEALYHYTMAAARKVESDTLKANAWHHRSDALSSLATIIGIGGAMLGGWSILDPLAACLISLFIVAMAWSLLKPGIDELMEKSLPLTEKAAISRIITSTSGVQGYHRLRTRRMGVNRAVEAHIKLKGDITLFQAHEIATAIETRIKREFGLGTHVGLHMEPVGKSMETDAIAQIKTGTGRPAPGR